MTPPAVPARQLGAPFRLLWSATWLSNLGDGIALVAVPLAAASLTRDPLLIAAVASAQRLPWLLFVLVSGVIVDRSDRRRLQQAANLARALLPTINNRSLAEARRAADDIELRV